MNLVPEGDERRKEWRYTGCSVACQILQGQEKSIDMFTGLEGTKNQDTCINGLIFSVF